MMQPINGRMMYYGKGDVLDYRTYAKPLQVSPIPESAYQGNDNVIFAHNIKFAITGEAFLGSFTEGDNSMVVATDSMKNFILRNTAQFTGNTTEGLLAFIGEKFLETYAHVSAISITGDRLPFDAVNVQTENGFAESGLVFRRSHNEASSSTLELVRTESGFEVSAHSCKLTDVQLIKVKGSSFYGFIRDQYTTLPESFDRPLFIFLNIGWKYENVAHALSGDEGYYAAPEQIYDITTALFHELNSPSIQSLIYKIGLRILQRFPQLSEVFFESNNRTWETVVDIEGTDGSVFTEPRPPYGFQGFTVTREDLRAVGEEQ